MTEEERLRAYLDKKPIEKRRKRHYERLAQQNPQLAPFLVTSSPRWVRHQHEDITGLPDALPDLDDV